MFLEPFSRNRLCHVALRPANLAVAQRPRAPCNGVHVYVFQRTDNKRAVSQHTGRTCSTKLIEKDAHRLANESMSGLSRSLQGVNHKVREGAHLVSDKTVSYIREEPVKAVLIAAASGIALMALARIAASNHPRALH